MQYLAFLVVERACSEEVVGSEEVADVKQGLEALFNLSDL